MTRSSTQLSQDQRQAIETIVGRDYVRFDLRERRVYSHDTSVLPRLLRRITSGALADAVVRPRTELEVVDLLRYAARERIPVVPRGKATSGYGGAVPTRGGVVLDLCDLNGIVSCDVTALRVTVGAGVTWKDLEATLHARGLGLRLYPTSAPASTVGGWLAQGGAGIGSHQFGWFADNVLGARVVTGTGDVHQIDGAELQGIADAEGTTGIITEVTLAVQPARDHVPFALAWTAADGLFDALRLVREWKLPVWSFQFANPESARRKNATPHFRELPRPLARLPEDTHLGLLVCEAAHADLIAAAVPELCFATGGEVQSADIAAQEWSERFKPLRLKRLGPSLIPFEVVAPASQVASVLDELASRIDAPLAIEGLSVRGDEVVLIGLMPHDERTSIRYTFAHGFVISALEVAERHGGRAYSTGRFFGSRARSILSQEKIAALQDAKQRHDPAGILNPDKVIFGDDVLTQFVSRAAGAEPLVRRFANCFGQPTPPAARLAPKRQFLADVASYAYACAQCGYCVDVCPQYHDAGWESSGPRGKWFLLKEVLEGRDRFDNELRDIFGLCSHCGQCDQVCQLELPIEPSWREVKASLFEGILTRTS